MGRRVASALVAVIAFVALAGCSLLADTTGLSGPDNPVEGTDAGRDGDATSIGDAPSETKTDGGGGGYLFTDDFERANGSAIGNGWTEKTEPAFELMNGAAFSPSSPLDYQNNLVYRPAAEDQTDVEVSIELVMSGTKWPTPQIFARAQRGSLGGAASYDGYMLFLANEQTLAIGRQLGDKFVVVLGESRPNPLLANANRYRLTLRVRGTAPVTIDGTIERQEGGAWKGAATVTVTDSGPTRISGGGAFGFSASSGGGLTYDNFVARSL